MVEEAIRTMQQHFTSALDGLTRHNSELQAELAQSRQQAVNELAALMQEVRAPQRGSQTTGVGVDTAAWESQATFRVLEMRGETGARCAWDTLAQQCHDCRS